MKMNILLRGDTFRDCTKNTQIAIYKSIITHVIEPLHKNCNDINIIVVTYSHPDNWLIKDVFKDFTYFYFEIRKSNQVNGFITSLNIILDNNLFDTCEGIIILRSDLYFLQDIDYTRKAAGKILFQWNLLHEKSSCEMADQIHFIGGDLIHDFITKINTNIINTKWPTTLHNLFNFCVVHFGKDKISYLNHIEDPSPTTDRCKIRGNPEVEMGNPLYTYSRCIKPNN
jgi:hypothetical protein